VEIAARTPYIIFDRLSDLETAMKLKAVLWSAAAFGLLTVPASGHHVSALIDYEKTVEVQGTVKQFRWTNPHSWLTVQTAAEGAQMVDWTLEMGSPGTLSRRGWTPRSVAPGTRVTVKLYPMKDGTPGGQLLTVTMPDGKVMSGE
jgi:hypothetical protein